MYDKEYTISLTGEDSHKVTLPRGQGSFSIGTKGLSKGKYDVWVERDCAINWDAFNNLYTGYGQGQREKYPCGDWPRWFYYSGNDTGFIEWSRKRSIEEFHWMPHADAAVDFTDADIYRLFIDTNDSKIEILPGEKTKFLGLSGRLENFAIRECDEIPLLAFYPACPKEEAACRLPVYKALAQAEFIEINHSPDKAAFDCASLLQFGNLRSLHLRGNLTGLSALACLEKLESLALRYVPDLQGMPGLETWESLRYFIGWNIEETAGKALRAELNKLKKEREMEEYSSVTKLHKKIWFAAEYGLPFSSWEEVNAKKAARAYKSCFNQIKKAKTEEEAQAAITEFIEKINRLEGIETTEREDVSTAVSQLVDNAPVEISDEKWMQWFDEVRDF